MNPTYTLITGASSGIGLALAKTFAREKHNLILVARREDKLKALAEELRKTGVLVEVIPADLGNAEGAEKLFKQVMDKALEVDILVNNAGRGNAGEFVDQSADEMLGTIELNMTSLTLLSRLFLGPMKARGKGHILNIASVAGFMPGPGMALYHATKAFVLSLSEALNAELSGSGISVTASCPGPTESEFHGHADTLSLKSFKILHMMSAEQVAKEAYDAMTARKSFIVHGVMNRLMVTSPKLMPRRAVARIVKTLMAK